MDPMSAITAGLGALTSIFKAVGGIADAVDSFAGLAGKFFDTLSSMIKEPQGEEATQVADETTSDWPQGQRDYALSTTGGVFTVNSTTSLQLPQAQAA